MYRIIVTVFTAMVAVLGLMAQEGAKLGQDKSDSLALKEIQFTPASASAYIDGLLDMELLWDPANDSIKYLLARLLDHYHQAYDSVENKLQKTQFLPAGFHIADTLLNDTLDLRWLNDSTFIIDTLDLGKNPLFVQKTVVKIITDSLVLHNDSIVPLGYPGRAMKRIRDTIVLEKDPVLETMIDTALLESNNIKLYQIKNRRVLPELFPAKSNKRYHFLADGLQLIISRPVQVIVAEQGSPFHIVPHEKVPDSLKIAVQTLLAYTGQRDSIPLFLSNIEGIRTPFWLTEGESELSRYWVKNKEKDSVSIWLGNPDKNSITLRLEDNIYVERIEKERVDDVPFTMATPWLKLLKVEPLEEIPVYWDYDFYSSFLLSQNYLSNWAKGGENSLSNLLDIKAQAKYKNKETKSEWTSNGRLRYGSVKTEENGLRKNTDIWELDSKYNKVIREKIDFSALFHTKSQMAKGYNYPNDSVVVSRFLNPGTFTVGVGLEYKPFKKSTINFSALSYKNTFVLDTASIDQSKHGIDKDKKAKQEMGGQLLIKNELILFDDLSINNSLRLFSNYMVKPENLDVEWELNLEKQISLYFTIQLNIHMIYDEDILFAKLDKNDEPILLPDGSEKKVPKLQFKEFLGLTFQFKI
jgi:hypothetical protein